MQNPTFDSHIRQAVNRGEFSADPFPYLFVTELLPPGFYDQLTEAWPSFEEMWRAMPTIGRVDFIDPRMKVPWVSIEQTSLSRPQLDIWREFRALIDGPFFQEAFIKFKPYMKEYGRELLTSAPVEKAGLWNRMLRKGPKLSFWERANPNDFVPHQQFLVNRKDLSVLSPHVDSVWFHFTLIVYFAPDRDHAHLGTTLFRQKQPGRACLPSETENVAAQFAVSHGIPCEEARFLPFLPNAALLFLNGLHSWHGQHLSEPIERRSYNSFFTARNYEAAMRHADIEKLRRLERI